MGVKGVTFHYHFNLSVYLFVAHSVNIIFNKTRHTTLSHTLV